MEKDYLSMKIKQYCRRFRNKHNIICTAYADSYYDNILQESDEFEDWYWLDAVPFIEEYDDGQE